MISWRHGNLLDDDFNKFLEFKYAAHEQGTDYDTRYVLGCSGMKKSGWTCTKHERINIRLNSTDEKNINIQIKKGQKIQLIYEMGTINYQIDNSDITGFLACEKDEYAGFKNTLMNYIIYEKSFNRQ